MSSTSSVESNASSDPDYASDDASIASRESLPQIAPRGGADEPFVCRCSQTFSAKSGGASLYYQHLSSGCERVTFESLVPQDLPRPWKKPVKCRKCSKVLCSSNGGMANHAKACLRPENDNDQAHYTKDNLWQEVQQPIPGQDPRVDLQADAVGPRADRYKPTT